MANAKTKEAIDIADFFVATRESEGEWFEPLVDGKPSGIELKVLGKGSDKVIRAGAEYLDQHKKLEDIKDPAEVQIKEREIVCQRIAKSVVGMRGKGGRLLVKGGKPVEYSEQVIEELVRENMDIRTEVLAFSSDQTNYMKK